MFGEKWSSFIAAATMVAVASGQQTPSAGRSQSIEIALATWCASHGADGGAVIDPDTGYASFLHGGATSLGIEAKTDAEFASLARTWVRGTRSLHGIDEATLVDDEVMFLPLGLAGSTDKMSVRLREQIGDIDVLHGFVHVLFDLDGRLLSIDSTALPDLAGFDTQPTIDAERGLARARVLFTADTRLAPQSVEAQRLVIVQALRAGLRTGVLAYEVRARREQLDAEPEDFTYWIDARDGSLVERRSNIDHFDVSGTVVSLATPGLRPDVAGNAPSRVNMRYIRVHSPQGDATTDATGNFTIVGASVPLTVTVGYAGTFNAVHNASGVDFSKTQTLTLASNNQVILNRYGQTLINAQANAFNWTCKLRDWTRSVNPTDATADFLMVANVDINDVCNAYYDGASTNYFLAGSGCVNTAYSTVILHENGHWLNDRYGSGNGSDGFGEGNADVFAMYCSDNPVVGQDFHGTGTSIRTGLNTRQFCGDSNDGCYGEVHADGEVLMGALWKVRSRLKTTNGSSTGLTIANTLFNSWMNAYNDSQIKTVIETHWLTLDDNDGNLANGTPHFADIDGGFRDQGFPGICLLPATPSNLHVVSVNFTSVQLAWNDNANNETAYRVARLDPGHDPNDPNQWNNVSSDLLPNTTTFTDGALQSNSTYGFKVRAKNDCGFSAYSNIVYVTTLSCPSAPPAPTNCVAARITTTPNPDPIRVTWDYGSATISGFRVARLNPGLDPNNDNNWTNVGDNLPTSPHEYIDTSVTLNGQTYQYKVRAFLDNPCAPPQYLYSPYSNSDGANP